MGDTPWSSGRSATSWCSRRGDVRLRRGPRSGVVGPRTRPTPRATCSSAREHPRTGARYRPPPARRWVGQLEPVELGFGSGWMVDDRVVTTGRCLARLAMRPQRPGPQTAGEARIGTLIAERDDLVEQGGRPQVRVISEPDLGVLGE